MKRFATLSFLLFSTAHLFAQLDLPASGGNTRAKITEEVGITDITIAYSRPDVNKREGKIWGELVSYGFTSGNFNTGKSNSPWRAGANENTTISFEHDVKVEGKNIKAGTYALFMAVWPDSAQLIFSTQNNAWGSFYYDEKYDALRVTVKPVVLDKSVEWLKYEFVEQREKYCVAALQWEKLSVPFKIEVDVDNIVTARLRDELTSRKSFTPALVLQATQYWFNKNMNLEEALLWSKRAIDGQGGQKTFITLRNLAMAYEKLNRVTEADSAMNEALLIATANQYTAYGRQLIAQKRVDKAMVVLLASQKRYGDMFGVNSGLMSAYSAKGDFKNAIKYAEKALAQAANDTAKKTLESQIAKLKESKDVN